VVSKAGTYMLSVTDNDNGCSANASVFVNANQASPDAQIAVPATITCTMACGNIDRFIRHCANNHKLDNIQWCYCFRLYFVYPIGKPKVAHTQ